MTADPRPKRFPPPEFPPRRVPAFARTPPAIFPVLLGLCGLALALRAGLDRVGLSLAPADLAAGLVLALWAFGVLAYGLKLRRRPAVVIEDLKVLPGRVGLAAMGMGGMVAAALVVPFSPRLAEVLLLGALLLHGIIALLTLRVLAMLPPEARDVTPGWHLSFTGFIVAGPAALALGQVALATAILYLMLPVAGAIWAVSLAQLSRQLPPPPLRPLLAIHLAPAALLALVAEGTGHAGLARLVLVLLLLILPALALATRWMVAAGFSALWGAFTFPLTACATVLTLQAGVLGWVGLALMVLALVLVPAMAWRVLRLWPGGQLAAKTNAAEA